MKIIKVTSFKELDMTYYLEGTFVTTGVELGVILNGTVEPILFPKDVKKMVQAEVKKELKKREK